jgi:hypothetical protein
MISKIIHSWSSPVVLQISHDCFWETYSFTFSSCSTSYKRQTSLGRGVLSLGLFLSFVPGAGKHKCGLLLVVGCASLWLLLGLGMDDTCHQELWRPASGSFPSWQGSGQNSSKQLGCQWKLAQVLSLAGKLLVPGLATILNGNVE